MRSLFIVIVMLFALGQAQAATIAPAFGKWSSAGGSVDAAKQNINTMQVIGATFSKPGGKPTMTIGGDSTVVKTSGNQSIAGTKTFSSPIVSPNTPPNKYFIGVGGFSNLSTAKASIGDTKATLEYSSDLTVTNNITIPATLELMPLNGAVINHGTYTITFTDTQQSRWPLARVFNGTGAITGLKKSSPEYFGAVGDGVVNDYAAINAAINAAAGTGRVILSKGAVYASASRILIPSNTYISGGGTLKALPLGTSGAIQGFLYGDALSNVTVDGIRIDSDPATQTHPLLAAVYITGSTNIKFANNEVVCSYSGVYIRAGSSKVMVKGNTINNSYGSSTDAALQHGPSIIVGANDSTVTNNKVTGIMSTAATDSYIATGIYAGTDTGVTYTNVVISSNTVRYSYTAIAANGVNGLVVTGNALSDCRTNNHSQAILLTNCKGANISSNVINNIDYTAIGLMDCTGSVISGNSIANDADFLIGTNIDSNRCNGITVSQTANGLSKNNSVVGNVITVGGFNASASYSAILVYGDGSVVSNNKADVQALPVSYGLQFSGENFMVNNNTLLASYMALRPLTVADWTVTKNNVIENNIISGTTNSIYDTSTGPNRYISNTILQGTQTYSNPHYRTTSDSRTVTQQKTADYSLALADGGIAFVGSSSGVVKFTLPSATTTAGYSPLGLTYRFSRIFAQAVRIAPQAGETIRGGGVSKYLELTGYGSVEITCLTSGVWEITKSTGTTAFEP